jgi:16S rRNA (guanine966-N2)-methyltransferase
VRIIGGTLRGRRLPVIADAGLRPTPDRVRETLFNWLAPHIEGSRCLDLFAGCGALGVEALSRGAAHCTFVETGHAAARSLATTLDTLGLAARARLVMGNARRFLGTTPAGPFDIIFLDPPFDSGLLAPCLADLPAILAPRAWIYVEQPRGAPLPPLPAGLHVHRCGQTRQISYLILAGPASHGHEAGAGGAEDAGGAASGEALPEPAP